jgi:hypothetical protein
MPQEMRAMSAHEFAKALRLLIRQAQEAGLDRETLLGVIEDAADAI